MSVYPLWIGDALVGSENRTAVRVNAHVIGSPCARLQCASIGRVTTLYIRDVSEEVAETLKERAAAAGMSLSAYVAGELTKIATRPTNAEIVRRLKARNRSAGPSTADIVDAVRASRR